MVIPWWLCVVSMKRMVTMRTGRLMRREARRVVMPSNLDEKSTASAIVHRLS
jgi:hypothetical protein